MRDMGQNRQRARMQANVQGVKNPDTKKNVRSERLATFVTYFTPVFVGLILQGKILMQQYLKTCKCSSGAKPKKRSVAIRSTAYRDTG
jgi:hypothetical protein